MTDGRKVLVTGGSGFVGSHLVERLVANGAAVTTLDRRPRNDLKNLASVLDKIEAVHLDLVSSKLDELIGDSKFDLIIHLAASTDFRGSVDDPKKDFEQNASATLNLLQAVRWTSPQTEIVHVSSALAYSGGGGGLIGEDAPMVPKSPYGISKLAAELYVSVFARLYGLRTVVGRPFAVFGPRLRKHVVYEIVARLLADGDSLEMRGDGTEVRDFTYVSDIVDGLLLLADRAPKTGEAYNVASGQYATIGELIGLIAGTMGLTPAIAYSGPEGGGATSQLKADIRKLGRLGYVPQVSLAEGVRSTVDWVLNDVEGGRLS